MQNLQNVPFHCQEVICMHKKKIRQLAVEFVLYKRSMGYVYETASQYLFRYIDYSESIDMDYESPKKNNVSSYLETLEKSPASMYGSVCVLREFSRYLMKLGLQNVYVIPAKTAAQPVATPPYFFTEKEITNLFRQIDLIKRHCSFKGRELVVPAIFRLLYCCGLRGKEARTLLCQNVHLQEMYMDIIQSKGPKSRRIFISKELSLYLTEYDNQISIIFPDRKYFFPRGNGYYTQTFLSNNFRKFWKEAYPEFILTDRPRSYDLRHHFAWANLNRWASEGMDMNVMLAYLMRYMGHQNISETLYYFHFVPEFFPTFCEMTSDTENILPEVPDEK